MGPPAEGRRLILGVGEATSDEAGFPPAVGKPLTTKLLPPKEGTATLESQGTIHLGWTRQTRGFKASMGSFR